MLIYSGGDGNTGADETVSFKFWDGTAEWDCPESFTFVSNAVQGSGTAPFVITTAVTQTIALSQGWTWISINVAGASSALNDVLSSIASSSAQGDIIKSMTAFSDFYPNYGWFGTLNTIEATTAYKLKMGTAAQ